MNRRPLEFMYCVAEEKAFDILHYEHARPDFRNEPKEVLQERSTGIAAITTAHRTESLTWGAAEDQIDVLVPDIFKDCITGELRNVGQAQLRGRPARRAPPI